MSLVETDWLEKNINNVKIIDSNKKAFKELFLEQFKNEILNSTCKVDSEDQIKKIQNNFKSFKPQVNPSDINFFKKPFLLYNQYPLRISYSLEFDL